MVLRSEPRSGDVGVRRAVCFARSLARLQFRVRGDILARLPCGLVAPLRSRPCPGAVLFESTPRDPGYRRPPSRPFSWFLGAAERHPETMKIGEASIENTGVKRRRR